MTSAAQAGTGQALKNAASTAASKGRKAKQKANRKVKGQMSGIDSLGPLALAIVSLAIIVGVGAIVLTQMQSVDAVANNTAASGVLDTGVNALQTFGSFFTVIVVIGIAAVLFLLLGAVKRAGGTSMA